MCLVKIKDGAADYRRIQRQPIRAVPIPQAQRIPSPSRLSTGDGIGCLPLEGKGDRLRWMRCSRNAALHGDGKRMLRILHLIRHVPCHLLLKEKASVAVPSREQTVHLRIHKHPTLPSPQRGGKGYRSRREQTMHLRHPTTAGAHTKLLKSTEREDFRLVELRRAQRRGPRPTRMTHRRSGEVICCVGKENKDAPFVRFYPIQP